VLLKQPTYLIQAHQSSSDVSKTVSLNLNNIYKT